MHISFNDDTKTIVIDTPAGNSITIDEQGKKIEIVDQNSNKLTMDTAGIKMESPKNIEINAKGNMTLKATGSMSLGAATIAAKADGNISVEGAMAKMAGQGITEITRASEGQLIFITQCQLLQNRRYAYVSHGECGPSHMLAAP